MTRRLENLSSLVDATELLWENVTELHMRARRGLETGECYSYTYGQVNLVLATLERDKKLSLPE